MQKTAPLPAGAPFSFAVSASGLQQGCAYQQGGQRQYGQLLHAYDSAVLPPELQRMLLLMFANVADADQTTQ